MLSDQIYSPSRVPLAPLNMTAGGEESNILLEAFAPLADLPQRTLTSLGTFFKQTGHNPSERQWEALADIAKMIDEMAQGKCAPHFYLSSLDPGVGKTQTLTKSIKELVKADAYRNVGVVVFLSRLDEIKSLVSEMGLLPDQFAIMVAETAENKELNGSGLGRENVDLAQVLFTTQQRLEGQLKLGKTFADCVGFHYLGQPRQVRVWDETLCPGRAVTVDRDSIGQLFQPFRSTYPDLATVLETVFTDLKAVEDRSPYSVPDFVSEMNVGLEEAISLLPDKGNSHSAEVVRSLWFLSGRIVTVRNEGKKKVFLDYQDLLPDDLAPMLVLDASGRVRSTYTFWEKKRGGLKRLKEGFKRYDDLTVRVWKQAGSKTKWKENPARLLREIAAMVNTKPEEDWLIIYHRPKSVKGFDLSLKLPALFLGDPAKLHFVTWGNHHGTNAYVGVSNVILAGTLFLPQSTIEGLGRAAAALPSSQGDFPPSDSREVALGEHRHNVLQAACRGSVRRSHGDGCAPCDLYVIAAPQSGIAETLPDVFPGARIFEWTILSPKKLRGRVKQVFDYVAQQLTNDREGTVPLKDVMQALGLAKGDLRRIRRHSSFQAAIRHAGYAERQTAPRGFVADGSLGKAI